VSVYERVVLAWLADTMLDGEPDVIRNHTDYLMANAFLVAFAEFRCRKFIARQVVLFMRKAT
jgi:anaerobic C4-dicarboxylate transporter